MRNVRYRAEQKSLIARRTQSWTAYLRSPHSFGAGKKEDWHVMSDVSQWLLSTDARALNNDMDSERGRCLHYMSVSAMGIRPEMWIWISLSPMLVTYILQYGGKNCVYSEIFYVWWFATTCQILARWGR